MERYKCKLCHKSFLNGRALGGHMRSHMLNNLAISTKYEQEELEHVQVPRQVSQESEFVSSSSSEKDGYGDEKGGSYGLRENPKRSMKLVEAEFSFGGLDHHHHNHVEDSIVVQDRESETESSKNPTRRRSKRSRKSLEYRCRQQDKGDDNVRKLENINSDTFEPDQQVSSVSDITAEEDVAFCLMMLSRDKWKKKKEIQQNQVEKLSHQSFHEYEEDDETDHESEDYIRTTIKNKHCNNNSSRSSVTKGKYKCETCNKVFKSYQALGGHRASHKKLKLQAQIQEQECFEQEIVNNNVVADKKVHECPYCYRVFSSGQALGGHKRSHVIGVAATNLTTMLRVSSKSGDNLSFIDLNLPAPVEDDDLSAVSDAEFVNHNQIKR